MVVTGNQIEMHQQQLGNCNLIEMGPFAGVQSWERWMGNSRLCYVAQLAGGAEEKGQPHPLCSSHHDIIWLSWFVKRFEPTPWRPQEFRNRFCSWIKAKSSSPRATPVCMKCGNCSVISSWPGSTAVIYLNVLHLCSYVCCHCCLKSTIATHLSEESSAHLIYFWFSGENAPTGGCYCVGLLLRSWPQAIWLMS